MRALLALVVGLSSLLALAPVHANHSPRGDCEGTIVEVNLDGTQAWYVEQRDNGETYLWQESNGLYADPEHRLQRGGSRWWQPNDAESCVDDPTLLPDLLVA